MNPFDSYMLNKVRRLKDVRTRYAFDLLGEQVKASIFDEYGEG